MLFKPDPTKPTEEVIFSKKKKIQIHPYICLNNIQVEKVLYKKRLGILLDEKLNFKQHIDSTILKMSKGYKYVIKKL